MCCYSSSFSAIEDLSSPSTVLLEMNRSESLKPDTYYWFILQMFWARTSGAMRAQCCGVVAVNGASGTTNTQHVVGTPLCEATGEVSRGYLSATSLFPCQGPFQVGSGCKIEPFLRFNLKFAQQELARGQDLKFNQGWWARERGRRSWELAMRRSYSLPPVHWKRCMKSQNK